MKPRKPIRKISAKRLAKLGGKVPFSSIRPRKEPRKWKNRIRLDAAGMAKLRHEAWLRASGLCQLQLPGCEVFTSLHNSYLSSYWNLCNPGQLAHIKSRGAGGEDMLDNVLWSCASCHLKSHNAGGNPCPRRPKV
jgi:hypothetical protein